MNRKDHERITCVQAWTCQFEKPTTKSLIDQLEPEEKRLFMDLRRSIVKALGVKPKLEWLGISWRWCEVFSPDGGLLMGVHLIPDPQNPRVALTLSAAFFENMPPSQLPKCLTAGLSNATAIGHQAWSEWAIDSPDMVEAVVELVTLAYKG